MATAVTAQNVGAGMSQSSPVPQRIAAAAQEFESVLLGQWLREAESSFGTVPESEDGDDAGGSQMNEFGVQQLATEIARRGGVGIAHLVQAGLMKSTAPPQVALGKIHVGQNED